jgi:hypothetical protein
MIEAWLNNPMFQSAVAPFAIAFIVALLLRPLGGWLAGLGFAAAFYTAVWMIVGFQFMPLTSTRKLLLAGAGAVVVGLLIELMPRFFDRLRPWVLGAGAAGVALWMIWPMVPRREGMELWLLVIPALAYAAWLVGGVDTLRDKPVATVIACLALGIGTGVSAVLGSSALLGQLGGAVAAAVGAYALVFLIRGEFAPRGGFSVPVPLLAATIGIASVVFARLPWYSLLPLVLVPLLAHLPVPQRWGVLARGLLMSAFVLPAAIAAIAITHYVKGPPMF